MILFYSKYTDEYLETPLEYKNFKVVNLLFLHSMDKF